MKIDPYSDGKRAARRAISAGVPRWGVLRVAGANAPKTESIDAHTGLPVLVVHVPEDLASQQSEFIRGHNDEILAGISSGEITRDFRPLLMSPEEIDDEFARRSLGRLDRTARPEALQGPDISLRVEAPKSRGPSTPNGDRPSWIVLRRKGEPPKQLIEYEAPVEVALAHDGRVLVVRDEDFDLVVDVETSQILNRYPRNAH